MGVALIAGSVIDGLGLFELRTIKDEHGSVRHHLRTDSEAFVAFGESYVSTIKSGSVKAWKLHRHSVQCLAVPVGEIEIVLFDPRAASPSFGQLTQLRSGSNHYGLVRIPSGIWYGFRGLSTTEAVIINICSLLYDPTELDRLPADATEIPYKWPNDAEV